MELTVEGGRARARAHAHLESGPADRRPWRGKREGPPDVCLRRAHPGKWFMEYVWAGDATAPRQCHRAEIDGGARPPLSRPIGHHRNLIRCQKSIPKKEKYLARVALKQAPARSRTRQTKESRAPLPRIASRRVASCGSFEYSYTQLASLWPGNHGGREGEREGGGVGRRTGTGTGGEWSGGEIDAARASGSYMLVATALQSACDRAILVQCRLSCEVSPSRIFPSLLSTTDRSCGNGLCPSRPDCIIYALYLRKVSFVLS